MKIENTFIFSESAVQPKHVCLDGKVADYDSAAQGSSLRQSLRSGSNEITLQNLYKKLTILLRLRISKIEFKLRIIHF